MKHLYLPIVAVLLSTSATHSLELGTALGFSRISEGGVTSTVTPVELNAKHQWRQLHLQLDYGLAVSAVSTYYRDTRTAVRSGSAIGTVQLAEILGPFELRYGAKLGLAPLTLQSGSLEDKVMTLHTYRSAGSAMGWQQPFVWLMNNYPALAAASLRTRTLPVTLGLELNTGYLFSLNQQPGRFAVHTRAQVSYDRYSIRPFAGFNHLHLSQSLENNDTDQATAFAGALFVAERFTFTAAANLNIDLPYGIIASGTRHFWGVTAGATYRPDGSG